MQIFRDVFFIKNSLFHISAKLPEFLHSCLSLPLESLYLEDVFAHSPIVPPPHPRNPSFSLWVSPSLSKAHTLAFSWLPLSMLSTKANSKGRLGARRHSSRSPRWWGLRELGPWRPGGGGLLAVWGPEGGPCPGHRATWRLLFLSSAVSICSLCWCLSSDVLSLAPRNHILSRSMPA